MEDSVTWTNWPFLFWPATTQNTAADFTVYHSANRRDCRPVMLTMLLYDHVLSGAVTMDRRAPVLQVCCDFCHLIKSAGTIFEQPLIVFVSKSETTEFFNVQQKCYFLHQRGRFQIYVWAVYVVSFPEAVHYDEGGVHTV